MSSVELSKLQGIGAARALTDSDRMQVEARRTAPAPTSSPAASVPGGVSIEVDAARVDPATPPVDPERVQQIRNALRDGSYPLVPTKIVDAMIAAQVSFAIPR